MESGSPQGTDDHKLGREIMENTIANSWEWKLGNSELFGAPTLGFLYTEMWEVTVWMEPTQAGLDGQKSI